MCRPVHTIDDNSSSSSDVPLIKLLPKNQGSQAVASESTNESLDQNSPKKSTKEGDSLDQTNKATTPKGWWNFYLYKCHTFKILSVMIL